MASPNSEIPDITTGSDTKEAQANTQTAHLDQLLSGDYTFNFPSDANDSLIDDLHADGVSNALRFGVFYLTSVSLTATRDLDVPDNKCLYYFFNDTTGGQSNQVKTDSCTGITIPNGEGTALLCDGTNVVELPTSGLQVVPTLLNLNELRAWYESVDAPAISSGTLVYDINNGNVLDAAMTENVTTLTINNPSASGKRTEITMIFTQDGTGSRLMTWPTSFDWAGATAMVLSTGVNDVDIVKAFTLDNGTIWHAKEWSKDSS